MKNIILLLSLMLSLSTSAQYARMIAVDLKEGGEKEYLELEKFWSQVHEEAVKKDFTMVGLFGKELQNQMIKNPLPNILFLKATHL